MTRIDPAAELTPQALEEIQAAIVHGYTLPILSQRLRYKWGMKLADEINVAQGFKFVVGDLIAYAEAQGKAAELLALAVSGRPQNPLLSAAAGRYLAEPGQAAVKYADAAPPTLPGSLEALVTTRSRLFGFGEFLARVRAIGARLCRVELPDGGAGTGWLVGASHLLTNYHVVQRAIRGEIASDQIVCRFDFWAEQEGAADPAGTPVGLAAAWLGASSPYSQSDLNGTGDPAPTELDYALLSLAEPAGNAVVPGGGTRGWFEFGPEAPIVARADPAMIPQHASGRPLEVAFGQVLEFPGTGMRYRYDVTTEPGSSGSPMFNADLTLLGLHHAADPQSQPHYNQAVPLWRIARDLAGRGVDWKT
jgi:hypothetical protein